MKTRFCPSPTGHIHLGNTRTALFSVLIALKHGGQFLLRIEDTDQSRSKQEYADDLQADLQWLGLVWQEGPGVEGDNGPYWQSQRQPIYEQFYDTLIEKGRAYSCFCTEQNLAMVRKAQRSAGQPPRYPGTCRNLSPAEIDTKIAEGLKPTLRFRMPDDEVIEFEDGVKGVQKFQSNDIGDFIIRRTDGTAPFMYCNAIDDALMGVDTVVRGEDHLTNTPRQLQILSALDLTLPTYAHIALIAGSDGSPLSKRHGSQSLKQLREAGYLPEALNNYLARVGHSYEHNELMDLPTLAAEFNMNRLGTSAARFDLSQLLFWQKTAVGQLTQDRFWQWVGAEISASVSQPELFFDTVHANVVFPGDVAHWVKLLHDDEINFEEDVNAVLKDAGTEFFKTALTATAKHGADFANIAAVVKTALNVKGKQLFQPLRVALTGQLHGPEMKNVVALLGDELTTKRFETVLRQLAEQ